MRILMINTIYSAGSTGRIVKQIATKAEKEGFECLVAHRYKDGAAELPSNVIAVSSWLDCHIHNRLSRLTMLRGCFSVIKTFLFLKKVDEFNPDLIHLHNINGNFINLSMLFRYIKKRNIKVVWTLHDCWAVTGHCKHFESVKCTKWKARCGNCPLKGKSLLDLSSYMHKKKQNMFTSLDNMTVVVPSVWLKKLIGQSYLNQYPIEVINNGIDLEVFKPTPSDFRKKYGVGDKKIILGVSFGWSLQKGLDVFVDLAERLPKNYCIVLVGTDDTTDLKLPDNIISIHKTENQKELASIYTAADVFLNPTREDNYPTVNMEALACGTPVVTFATGGSAEIIDETCGYVVEDENLALLRDKLVSICDSKCYPKESCLRKAQEHNMNNKFDEYIRLYEELI